MVQPAADQHSIIDIDSQANDVRHQQLASTPVQILGRELEKIEQESEFQREQARSEIRRLQQTCDALRIDLMAERVRFADLEDDLLELYFDSPKLERMRTGQRESPLAAWGWAPRIVRPARKQACHTNIISEDFVVDAKSKTVVHDDRRVGCGGVVLQSPNEGANPIPVRKFKGLRVSKPRVFRNLKRSNSFS